MEAELPKDFYNVGMDINSDGKLTYYGQIAKKGSGVNTYMLGA